MFYLVHGWYSSAQDIGGMIKYRYKTIESDDGTQNYNIASYLYFNKSQSLYVLDRYKDMEEKDKLERSFNETNPVSDTLRPYKRKRDEYGQQYFKDNTTQTLKVREFIERKPFYTEEPIPRIQWQMLNERKKIGKYTCNKAMTTFRGRTYEVWYTLDIPLNIGPWKLQGLPGAILEAKSKDGKVAFEVEEIHIPYDTTNELVFRTGQGDKKLSFEEYKKAPETEAKKEADRIVGMFQPVLGTKIEYVKYSIRFRIETTYE